MSTLRQCPHIQTGAFTDGVAPRHNALHRVLPGKGPKWRTVACQSFAAKLHAVLCAARWDPHLTPEQCCAQDL